MTESIAPKSDQMNAEDLLSGPRTFTIVDVREGNADQPVLVFLAQHPQPFKPSKTVRRLMVVAWGADSAAYIGKRMTLYRDPEVTWGGQDVGGIRVSHMSGISKQLSIKLAVRKGQRALYVVDPLPDAPAPARGPSRLDALVAAFDAAGIVGKMDRLTYCRGIVQRDLGSANDLTAAELVTVVEALQQPVEPSDLDLEPSEEEIARTEGQAAK